MTLPDRDALSDYISVTALEDYAPVTDPTTDVPASAIEQVLANVAMMSRMCPRAWVLWRYDGASVSITDHDALWGNSGAVAPVVTRSSMGHYLITWPATVTDPLGETHSVNFKRAWPGTVESNVQPYWVMPRRQSANTFDVYIRDGAGVVTDATGEDVFVAVV